MHERSLIPKKPFEDDFFDVYACLSVSRSRIDRARVDDAYARALASHGFDVREYFAWKLLRDPYYRSLLGDARSFRDVYDAGFFLDTLEPDDVHVLDFHRGECRTPISHVARNMERLSRVKRPVVLLCTGAFSPIHNGHIGMMFKARETLEQRGYQVVGGYVSPSHDAYVSEKNGGSAAFPASHRVYLAQHAVADTGWLFVDPWESRYVPTDINFTDVIARLEAYLNFYLKSRAPIRVAYVFGGDNVLFSRAFLRHGLSVCVNRGSSRAREQFGSVVSAKARDRVLFADSSDIVGEISSTRVRQWQQGLLPDTITRTYLAWRLNMLRDIAGGEHAPRKLYVLRDDRSWSLGPWEQKVSHDSLHAASDRFLNGFKKMLVRSFRQVSLPDRPSTIELAVHSIGDQMVYLDDVAARESVLNLDICTNEKREGAIQISRCFSLCDGQVRALRLVPRPGYPSLEKQLARLRAGSYTLLDDDISSGTTISMLLGSLPERVRVNKVRTLTDYTHGLYLKRQRRAIDLDVFDLVDLRDFLFGARASGLVIELPNGKLARAPYSLPYISLTTRANIPPSAELYFSKEVWRLNHEFFMSLDRDLFIRDTDRYFQEFCRYLGFSPRMSMVDFCAWHIDTLLHYV